MQEQDIDIELWDYIDGNCNSKEKARIAQLIDQNEAWQLRYNELIALNEQLQNSLELSSTSQQFVAGTMDKITPVSTTSQKLKPFLKWGIRAVAAFFIVAMSTLTIYSISVIDWDTSNSILTNVNLDYTSTIPTSYLLFGILIFGLLCAEQLFRRRAV